MPKYLLPAIIGILLLVMAGLVAYSFLNPSKAPIESSNSFGPSGPLDFSAKSAASPTDSTRAELDRQKILTAHDSDVKNYIDQIGLALQAYHASSPGGTYPSEAQGINMLISSGYLKNIPTGFADGKYKAGPVGCTGDAASPCTSAVLFQPLALPVAPTNVWCWQAKLGRAQEVLSSDCTP